MEKNNGNGRPTEEQISLYERVLPYLKSYLVKTEFKPIDRLRLSRTLDIKEWELSRLLKWLVIKDFILKNQPGRGFTTYKKLSALETLSVETILKWIEEYNFDLAKKDRIKTVELKEKWQDIRERINETSTAYFGFYTSDGYQWFSSMEKVVERASLISSKSSGMARIDIVMRVAEIVSQPSVVYF